MSSMTQPAGGPTQSNLNALKPIFSLALQHFMSFILLQMKEQYHTFLTRFGF